MVYILSQFDVDVIVTMFKKQTCSFDCNAQTDGPVTNTAAPAAPSWKDEICSKNKISGYPIKLCLLL